VTDCRKTHTSFTLLARKYREMDGKTSLRRSDFCFEVSRKRPKVEPFFIKRKSPTDGDVIRVVACDASFLM